MLKQLLILVLITTATVGCSTSPSNLVVNNNSDTSRMPAAGYSAINCYDSADSVKTALGAQGAAVLCSGATSSAPIRCYESASSVKSLIGAQGAVTLCTGATSLDPIDCFDKADKNILGPTSAAILCSSGKIRYPTK